MVYSAIAAFVMAAVSAQQADQQRREAKAAAKKQKAEAKQMQDEAQEEQNLLDVMQQNAVLQDEEETDIDVGALEVGTRKGNRKVKDAAPDTTGLRVG